MIRFQPAPAALPAGQRIYAIGDVHGCADRLAAMHALVAADLRDRPAADPTVIHMGDYIDRGPDSAGVIGMLTEPGPASQVIDLCGNHEEMLLVALATGDTEAGKLWLENGGDQALQSWGIPPRTRPRDWALAIPPRHQGFLRGLSLMHRAGGYLFVHAGIQPKVPLERQSRHDMLWIREPFLNWRAELPFVVVHGHTPEDHPQVLANRIGVDTGAVMGGDLTCAVLESDVVGFLHC